MVRETMINQHRHTVKQTVLYCEPPAQVHRETCALAAWHFRNLASPLQAQPLGSRPQDRAPVTGDLCTTEAPPEGW